MEAVEGLILSAREDEFTNTWNAAINRVIDLIRQQAIEGKQACPSSMRDKTVCLPDSVGNERQRACPSGVGVDEETAIRAMWSLEFVHALLMLIEDAKRGVDSSDDVRRAAYQALRSFLSPSQELLPVSEEDIASVLADPIIEHGGFEGISALAVGREQYRALQSAGITLVWKPS